MLPDFAKNTERITEVYVQSGIASSHVLMIATALAFAATGQVGVFAEDAAQARIVSLDGGTTETLFALGAGPEVVARDSGSTYPPGVKELPEIGFGHQISVEAVLGLKPTVIVGRDRSMSGPAMHLLEQAHAHVVRLDDSPGIEAAKKRIARLGELVGRPERAAELLQAMDADLARLDQVKGDRRGAARPRVLIVYLRPGATMLMGEESNAAAMLALAGGEFALPGLTGYKELNAEAVVGARPDIVLCYEDGLESIGGPGVLWSKPGLAETPAGRNKRVVAMEDLLLAGFGPRTGQAALALHHLLYGESPAGQSAAR